MEKLPMISSRIHRRPDSEADDGAEQQDPTLLDGGVDTIWTSEDTETRLRIAYDKNGFSGWAEAALNELEAERERERLRRERLFVKENKALSSSSKEL